MTTKPTATTVSWSPGTGPKSARFAPNHPEVKEFVVHHPTTNPHAGLKFLKSFSYRTAKLSSGLVTDREWSAAQASVLMIKGYVDLETIAPVLSDEGLFPVIAKMKDGTSKALATIWINELTDSVCGAYKEIVISFDVHHQKDKEVIAFDERKNKSAYAIWYNNFGSDVCEAQFLHTLYIDSPLSIQWGREMQAFPKHPQPVDAVQDICSSNTKKTELRWGEDLILKVKVEKKFGIRGFLAESVGLLGKLGVGKVVKFLASSQFYSNIVMPQKTANQYKVSRDYVATIWKGLHPTAVQVWPWNSDTDKCKLGSVERDTGCEANNGAALLRKANFQPISCCYLDKASVVVEESAAGV